MSEEKQAYPFWRYTTYWSSHDGALESGFYERVEGENRFCVVTPTGVIKYLNEHLAQCVELAELRAEVARLKAENDKLHGQVITSERFRLEDAHDAEQRFAAAKDEREWLPIADEPEKSGRYLVFTESGFIDMREFYKKRDGDECSSWSDDHIRITHWQPLPPPPENK